jgi:hypothetical protein
MTYRRFAVSSGTGKSKETKISTEITIMRACIYANRKYIDNIQQNMFTVPKISF